MSRRSDAIYLDDILQSVLAIADYVKNCDFEEFRNDRKTYSATIREFEIIGEAIGKISEDIKIKYPDVAWRDIKDFRNLLIHEYFGVDAKILWNTINNDLPELGQQVTAIISSEKKENNE